MSGQALGPWSAAGQGWSAVAPQSVVVVHYLVHHAGANGMRAPRAFALARRTLAAGVPLELGRRHTFAQRSVRRLYPGRHRVEIQVNGRVLGGVDIDLREDSEG